VVKKLRTDLASELPRRHARLSAEQTSKVCLVREAALQRDTRDRLASRRQLVHGTTDAALEHEAANGLTVVTPKHASEVHRMHRDVRRKVR
jgi:hypothetical protein